MRDDFNLVEFTSYLFGVALVLPLVKVLRSYSELAAAMLTIIAIAPFPLFIARYRWTLPKPVDSWILYQSAVMIYIGFGTLLVLAVLALVRWLT